MLEGIHYNQAKLLAEKIAYDQSSCAQTASADKSEIETQMQRAMSNLHDTASMLSSLHQRLTPVMPPSSPEPGEQISGNTEKNPSSPLGNMLAEIARMAQRNNDSILYILNRIKL